jgi:hypothetical protein
VEAPSVADGLHFVHDPFDRPEAGAREPVADNGGADQHDRRDEEHGLKQG